MKKKVSRVIAEDTSDEVYVAHKREAEKKRSIGKAQKIVQKEKS